MFHFHYNPPSFHTFFHQCSIPSSVQPLSPLSPLVILSFSMFLLFTYPFSLFSTDVIRFSSFLSVLLSSTHLYLPLFLYLIRYCTFFFPCSFIFYLPSPFFSSVVFHSFFHFFHLSFLFVFVLCIFIYFIAVYFSSYLFLCYHPSMPIPSPIFFFVISSLSFFFHNLFHSPLAFPLHFLYVFFHSTVSSFIPIPFHTRFSLLPFLFLPTIIPFSSLSLNLFLSLSFQKCYFLFLHFSPLAIFVLIIVVSSLSRFH